MKNKKTYIILAAVLAVLLIAAAALYPKLSKKALPGAPDESASAGLSDGETVTVPSGSETNTAMEAFTEVAAEFTVYDAAGKEVRLSDFTGKPVIMNFWASWCPPCRAELPYFNAAYESYGDQIVFLMVDLTDGYQETQSSGEALIRENGYTFPVYFDLEGSAAQAYSLYSIPKTVALDAQGSVVFSQTGALPEAMVQQLVDLLLG